MKRNGSVVWGLVLIILGVILAGNSLNIFNVDIFFDGWWTLFIIIPSFISLITDDDKTSSVIGILIGVILLLACQDVIDFSMVASLIFPVIIICIGLSLVFKNIFKKALNDEIATVRKKHKDGQGHVAVFSGQEVDLNKEKFTGTDLVAVFGGIDLDLRNAKINEDVVINTTSVFGGIDILVSDDYEIKINTTSIFGGVENHKKNDKKDKKHTIYVNATCVFGCVDIK